jgi:inner membrane protein
MPTILSHPAVPLAVGIAAGGKRIPPRLVAVGVVASILPDADGIGFWWGVAYASTFGHRGFTHSLLFALCLALAGTLCCRWLGASVRATFLFLFVSAASHSLLDAMTSGGLGVALLAPWSNKRFFLPFRPIAVSPLSLSRFMGPRGYVVLLSELKWIWFPSLSFGLIVFLLRHIFRRAGVTEKTLSR